MIVGQAFDLLCNIREGDHKGVPEGIGPNDNPVHLGCNLVDNRSTTITRN